MKARFEGASALLRLKQGSQPKGFDLLVQSTYDTFVQAFARDRPVVWVSCYTFPMELLWAFDVSLFDFEVACNLLPEAMAGVGSSIMQVAERRGYSRDICSFFRLTLGAHFAGMLPQGDLFLTSSHYCNGKQRTNDLIARDQGARSILLDVPNELSPASIAYVSSQLREIARALEELTGSPLDPDRLREAIRRSNRARRSSQEIARLLQQEPAPWDGYRACVMGILGTLFLGSEIREHTDPLLLSEITTRIAQGKVFPEEHRVLWYPWVPVQQTGIFRFLKERRVSVAMGASAHVYWSELDEDAPFDALARRMLECPYVGPAEARARTLVQLAADYHVDGVIHFATTSCLHEIGATPLIREALHQAGIRYLQLDGDMTDERNHDEGRTQLRLEAFVEAL